MAYDLVVSFDIKTDPNPKYIAALSGRDYGVIQRLSDRTKFNFLNRLLDPYKDEVFGAPDLHQAQTQPHELIISQLDSEERDLVYKLLAIIGFAISKSEKLYGVAD